MSEMTHVLAHTSRFNPTKRVARKLAPGNKRHVVLSNGMRLTRRGPRFSQIPIDLAKMNAAVLAGAVQRGVLEVFTQDRKPMDADAILALAAGKSAPKAAPAPKAPEPEKKVLEVKDEVKVEDKVEAKAPEVKAEPAKEKPLRRKSKKGKE